MAAPLVNLEQILKGQSATPISKADISRFKDADEGAPPRVVADSQDFIVYSLKSRTSLRVLPKQTATQLVFKMHTSPVHAARFSNHNGKIVASYSDKEVFVWGIDQEKNETFPYIHCPIEGVRGMCWVFGADKSATLVIIEGNAVKTLSVQKLIEQKVQVADSSAWTTINSSVKSEGPAFVVGRGKSLTVSVDGTSVLSGSVASLSGTAWSPADRKPLSHLAYCGTNLIAAVSGTSVVLWNVESEPRAVVRLELNGLPKLSTMESTSTQGGQSMLELYFVDGFAAFVNLEAATVAWTQLYASVRPKGFYSSTTSDSVTILADFGSVLAYSLVANSTKSVSLGVQLSLGVRPSYGKQQQGLQQPLQHPIQVQSQMRGQTQGAPIMMAQQPMMMQPQQMMQPNMYQQPQLRNPALASVGGGAYPPMAQQSEALNQAVAASKDELDRALGNLRHMITLQKTMLPVDHQKLSERALVKMGQELKIRNGAPSELGGAGGDLGGASYVTTEDDIKFFLMKLTGAITGGIAPAIEEIVASRLEPLMVEAMGKSNKKDLSAELKNKLDQALANASNDFSQRMEEKVRQHTEHTLLGYVRNMQTEYTKALGQLQEVIQQQHELLADYQRSNIQTQLADLKKEVTKLKANAAAGAAAAAASTEVAPSPETIVSAAKQFLEAKEYTRGLEWVTRFNDPDLVISLLTTLNDEELADALISDVTVPDVLWSKVVGFLCMSATVEAVEGAVWWIDAILADHETLQDNSQLKTTIGAFVKQWKSMPSVPASLAKNLNKCAMYVK